MPEGGRDDGRSSIITKNSFSSYASRRALSAIKRVDFYESNGGSGLREQ